MAHLPRIVPETGDVSYYDENGLSLASHVPINYTGADGNTQEVTPTSPLPVTGEITVDAATVLTVTLDESADLFAGGGVNRSIVVDDIGNALLGSILEQLKIANLHLSLLTDTTVHNQEVE